MGDSHRICKPVMLATGAYFSCLHTFLLSLSLSLSLSCRFLTSWVRVETSPGHAPITSLSWSPHGNFLVSASPADNSLITWDIPIGVATRIKRAKGGGLNHVLWSPDSQKVFVASVESVFRVWETQNWTCEKWTNFCGRCKVGLSIFAEFTGFCSIHGDRTWRFKLNRIIFFF